LATVSCRGSGRCWHQNLVRCMRPHNSECTEESHNEYEIGWPRRWLESARISISSPFQKDSGNENGID
jgi:hypothetical protein